MADVSAKLLASSSNLSRDERAPEAPESSEANLYRPPPHRHGCARATDAPLVPATAIRNRIDAAEAQPIDPWTPRHQVGSVAKDAAPVLASSALAPVPHQAPKEMTRRTTVNVPFVGATARPIARLYRDRLGSTDLAA